MNTRTLFPELPAAAAEPGPLHRLLDAALDDAITWRAGVDLTSASNLPRFTAWLRGVRQLIVDLGAANFRGHPEPRADLIVLTRRAVRLLGEFLGGPWSAATVIVGRELDLSDDAATWMDDTFQGLAHAHMRLHTTTRAPDADEDGPAEACRADLESLAQEMLDEGWKIAKRLPTAHRLIVMASARPVERVAA